MKLGAGFRIKWSLVTLVISFIVTFSVFQNCAPLKSGLITESSTATGLSVQINGTCGVAVNTCLSGDLINLPDSSSQSLWRCTGSGGGTDASCSSNLGSTAPLPGICGSTINNCSQGMLEDVGDSSTQYLWNCKGINGGAQASCSLAIPVTPTPVNGVCNNNVKNSCASGTFFDLSDSHSHYLWACKGINGGPDANPNCSQAIPSIPPSQITCTLSAPAITHVGDNYTYTVTTSGGSLPPKVNIFFYGTKANLDGSNAVTDATGSGGAHPQGASNLNTPLSVTLQNTGGTMAGLYTRSFGIIDPNTGAELCRTNVVTQRLTPACQLNIAPSTVVAEDPNGKATYSVVLPKAGEVALGSVPATASFYGTKNGVAAPTGVLDLSVGRFPLTDGPFPASTVGNYTRYLIVKNSSGQEICKSNTVSVSITSATSTTATCDLSVQSVSHFGDTYTYRVSSPNVVLPARVNINIYGTKANLDGSNVTTDATGPGGAKPQVIGTFNTPLQIDMVNYAGAQAGLYTRSFGIVDPATGREVCKTNVVTQRLTPACGLDISPSEILVGPGATDKVQYSVTMPNPGELRLGGSPTNVVFFGTKTKNGVTTNDETGSFVAPSNVFPYTDGPFNSYSVIGTYTRYFIVRDAGNNELCKTSTATVTFTPMSLESGD